MEKTITALAQFCLAAVMVFFIRFSFPQGPRQNLLKREIPWNIEVKQQKKR